MNDSPVTYCECGCGELAPIALKNNKQLGHVKGQPVRFVRGHHNKIRPIRPVEDRFWEKVDKRGPDECWDWTGCKDKHGYGYLNVGSHRIERAYRVSYELHNGPIPEGLDICHHCDRPPCVNPAHLFAGTAKDNIADMHKKGRFNKVEGEKVGNTTYSNAQAQQWREEFSQLNVSMKKFAQARNVPYHTMRHILRGNTYKVGTGDFVVAPEGHRKGELNERAKFTNAQARELRREFAEGKLSLTAFATFHNVPVNTMWNLLHYKTYKDA